MLLLAAIRNRDEDLVIQLMQMMPVKMLQSLDHTGANLFHYLAKFGLARAFKVAISLFNHEMLTVKNAESFSPMVTAIYYNAKELVTLLESKEPFASVLHRDAFFNSINLPIKVEDLEKEDGAGHIPLDYAVYGNHVEATKMLLQETPRKHAHLARLLNLFSHAIRQKNLNVAHVLARRLTELHIRRLFATSLKPFIDTKDNEKTLYQVIEQIYDDPADIVKQFIDFDIEEPVKDVLNKCAQFGCPKMAAGLLADFQTNKEDDRHETIDTMLQIATSVQVFKTQGKIPSLHEKDVLNMMVKVCKADLERHPEWLATVLAMPVRSGFTFIVDTLLRRMSSEAKQRILTYQMPAGEDKGATLLHIATKFDRNEVLLTLIAHGGNVTTKDAQGKTVRFMFSLGEKTEMMVNVASADISELFRNQCLYHRTMIDVLDESKLAPGIDHKLKTMIDEMNVIIKSHGVSKDQAFLTSLWRMMITLLNNDDDNPNLLNYFSILKNEINQINQIPGRLKNSLLALRVMFIMGEFNQALYWLNVVNICKNIDKDARGFNDANVPQLLMARMSLTIFDVIGFIIPSAAKNIIKKSIISASYNILMGVFCLDYISVEQLTASNLLYLFKKLDTIRHQVKEKQNTDLFNHGLNEKSDKDYFKTTNFNGMLSESEADINIFYHFLIKMEKKLWEVEDLSHLSVLIRECKDLVKLNRLLEFYRFKEVCLDLLQTALVPLKHGFSLANRRHSNDWWNRYVSFGASAIFKKIEHQINLIERQNAPPLDESLFPSSQSKTSHKSQTHVEPVPQVSHEEIYLHMDDDDSHCKDQQDDFTDLPTYHQSDEQEDRLWSYQGKSNEVTEKVGLRIPGVKKHITLKLPTEILDFMRSFGSDGCTLVGGAVRDSLCDMQPRDWDFIPNRTFDQLHKRFKLAREDGMGDKRTLSFKLGEYLIQLHPSPNTEKKFYLAFLNDLLAHRDFTANAMAINYFWNKYEQRENWQFIDPFGGHHALLVEKKFIPVPTNPPNVELLKDAIRLLRAMRQCDHLKLGGVDELFAIYKEKAIDPNDALFNATPKKLADEYKNLKEHFKDRLLFELEKRGILNVFIVRGIINFSPTLFTQPVSEKQQDVNVNPINKPH